MHGYTALVISLCEEYGKQGLQAGEPGRGLPDPTRFCRHVTMHVIGCNNVNLPCFQCRPQGLDVTRCPDRRADLGDVAAFPVDCMCEVVRTCLDGQIGAEAALCQRSF